MIETIMLIVVIFVLSGVFWYSFFYQKEKKLLNRLQQMLDCAIDGELERTEVSEEKYSALENSMKQYMATPMTSPVDFISGPRITSAPGKRPQGITASFMQNQSS